MTSLTYFLEVASRYFSKRISSFKLISLHRFFFCLRYFIFMFKIILLKIRIVNSKIMDGFFCRSVGRTAHQSSITRPIFLWQVHVVRTFLLLFDFIRRTCHFIIFIVLISYSNYKKVILRVTEKYTSTS